MTQGELDSLPVEVDGLRQPGYDVHLKILDRQRNLIELWVLADYLQIPGAQNLAVDELEQIRKDWGGIGFLRLEYIYESVADGAPLRELLFEHCWRFLDPIFYRSCPEYFSKKMLLEYFIRDKLSKQSSMPDPFTNRAEFVKRLHVPENRANSSSERSVWEMEPGSWASLRQRSMTEKLQKILNLAHGTNHRRRLGVAEH